MRQLRQWSCWRNSDKKISFIFDLSDFDVNVNDIQVVRTSGGIKDGENWADISNEDVTEINGKTFSAFIKGSSITTFIIK